ncbi:hypothetical protein AB0F93_00490 [Micromonospora tulbaghiae]|uniref:hypothetical protein n=1 Tax=Micromonospora tulbaghiae TaxID=479978 RepID=UPI00331CFE09
MTATSGQRARDLAAAAGFRAVPGQTFTNHPDDGTTWKTYQCGGDRLTIHTHPRRDRFARAIGTGYHWGFGRGTVANGLPALVRLIGPEQVGLLGLIRYQFGDAATQLGYSCSDDPRDVLLCDVRDDAGRVLWNAADADESAWPFLGYVVDLFAPHAHARPERGDGLLFTLTCLEVTR